jgi:hypothetical protein
MLIRKEKTIKFISTFLIISTILPTVLFFRPKQVNAQAGQVPVFDQAANKLQTAIAKASGISSTTDTKSWLQKLGEQLLKIAAKQLLAQMTQATINWINNGFHGSPLFIENPESFFRDIAKSQVRMIVDMIGYDDVRFPFGRQTALNVIASYKSQLETNAQYTLSKVINDPDLLALYRNDFNYGGWNGFLINTQYPQNNYLGFDMIIRESLGSQLTGTFQAPAEKVQSLLQQGMGFLSPQTCADNGGNNEYNKSIGNQFVRPSFKEIPWDEEKYRGASGSLQWEEENKKARADWEKANTCENLVSTTPGSVAANQIFNALDTPRESATLAGALGNSVVDSVGAIFDALINKLLGDGLNALADTINPPPPEDNWSYEGQTLNTGYTGGYTGPNGETGALNINNGQHSVLLETATTTSKFIAGGVGAYSLQTGALNTNIATVSISNNSAGATITIAGKGVSGDTSVIVQDSSVPPKQTIINITVSNPNELVTAPDEISINVNDTASAKIVGGNRPYSVKTGPNQEIAVVTLADNTLLISGIGLGQTSVTVRDSSSPEKTFSVPITVKDTSSLSVTQENVLIYTGGTKNVAIPFASGRINYNSNPAVANAVITNNNLQITNTKRGQTTIEVVGPNHSTQNPQIVEFYITIADPLAVSTPVAHSAAGYYTAKVSGGTAPYRIVGCPAGLVCGPLNTRIDYNSDILWIYTGLAKINTNIEVRDSGNQSITVPFVLN